MVLPGLVAGAGAVPAGALSERLVAGSKLLSPSLLPMPPSALPLSLLSMPPRPLSLLPLPRRLRTRHLRTRDRLLPSPRTLLSLRILTWTLRGLLRLWLRA